MGRCFAFKSFKDEVNVTLQICLITSCFCLFTASVAIVLFFFGGGLTNVRRRLLLISVALRRAIQGARPSLKPGGPTLR